MSELDGKLDYILKSNAAVQRHYDKDSEKDYDNLIPAIKQAFADDKTWHLDLQTFEKDGLPLMTGQEWYSRYRTEWNKIIATGDYGANSHIEAAKLASNIDK